MVCLSAILLCYRITCLWFCNKGFCNKKGHYLCWTLNACVYVCVFPVFICCVVFLATRCIFIPSALGDVPLIQQIFIRQLYGLNYIPLLTNSYVEALTIPPLKQYLMEVHALTYSFPWQTVNWGIGSLKRQLT